jgi:hypothetical protein
MTTKNTDGKAAFKQRWGSMTSRRDEDQLAALGQIHELFTRSGIDYWLFGGWAVDFHVGSITRSHDDIDVAVWLDDHERIAGLLEAEGWNHAPEPDEDGGTGYERDGVRLELTVLVPGDRGEMYIPLRTGRALWSEEPLSSELAELSGVRACVLGLAALKSGKARSRDDPAEAAKDREDNAGYGNLIKLASAGYLEGYYYKPRVDWELLQAHSTGLIALSGCRSGRVCKALEEARPAKRLSARTP